MEEQNPQDFEYNVRIPGYIKNIGMCLLLGVVCAMLSILTERLVASSDGSGVYAFFIGIVLVVLAVYRYGACGILTAIVNSALFSFALNRHLLDNAPAFFETFGVNIGVNTFQAILIWFVVWLFKGKNVILDTVNERNNHLFEIFQLLIGVVFVCSVAAAPESRILLLVGIFAGIEAIIYLIAAVKLKNFKKLFLAFCVALCFLPGLLSGTLNAALQFGAPAFERVQSASVWTLSNFILIASFGYLFLGLLNKSKRTALLTGIQATTPPPPTGFKRRNGLLAYLKASVARSVSECAESAKEIRISSSSVAFFIAALVWNASFFFMYCVDSFEEQSLLFILPWCIGNIMLLANLYFNEKQAAKRIAAKAQADGDAEFDTMEKRAVVAENNTHILFSVISFLTPLSASLAGVSIDSRMAIITCVNIACACIAIGLVWIPRGDIKTMNFLKTVKTIFHLFTVSLLLLNATFLVLLLMKS